MCLTRGRNTCTCREWNCNPLDSVDANIQSFTAFILAYKTKAILRTMRIEHISIIAILNCLCKDNLIPDFISFNRTAKKAHNIKGCKGYSRKRPDMIFCYTNTTIGKKYYIISEIDEYAHSTYNRLEEKQRYALITHDIKKIMLDNNTSNSVNVVVNWVRINPDTYKQGVDALTGNYVYGKSSREKLVITHPADFDKRINAYIKCIHNIISGNSDFSDILQYVKVFSTCLDNPNKSPKRKSYPSPYTKGKYKRMCYSTTILPPPCIF